MVGQVIAIYFGDASVNVESLQMYQAENFALGKQNRVDVCKKIKLEK